MIRGEKIPTEQIHALLTELISTAPQFEYGTHPTEDDHRWLAKAESLLSMIDTIGLALDFSLARKNLHTISHDRAALLHPLLKAFYKIEMISPVETRGTFIPAGDSWGGYAALVKVLSAGCSSILLVDPYLNGQAFCDFIPLVNATERIWCLTEPNYKQSLDAASERLLRDRDDSALPVEVRYAPNRSMHDRLIIVDSSKVWLVSQSLKDIAVRSPASLMVAETEIAQLKVQHYEALWAQSA